MHFQPTSIRGIEDAVTSSLFFKRLIGQVFTGGGFVPPSYGSISPQGLHSLDLHFSTNTGVLGNLFCIHGCILGRFF